MGRLFEAILMAKTSAPLASTPPAQAPFRNHTLLDTMAERGLFLRRSAAPVAGFRVNVAGMPISAFRQRPLLPGRQAVSVRSSRDRAGLSADRIQLGADLYEMKIDIGMQSMPRKCLEILPTCMGGDSIVSDQLCSDWTTNIAARVLLSRPVRTLTTGTPQDTQTFDFPCFRFDYILRKVNLGRNSQKQFSAIVSMNYKDFTADVNPPPSESGRKTFMCVP